MDLCLMDNGNQLLPFSYAPNNITDISNVHKSFKDYTLGGKRVVSWMLNEYLKTKIKDITLVNSKSKIDNYKDYKMIVKMR